MNGYIEFEFKLNGELYELETEYDDSDMSETDINSRDDSMTVYNLITNAVELKVKGKNLDKYDLEEMLDEKAVITEFAVYNYDLYEEYAEQIAVDDFIEHTESVIIW